MPRVKVIDADGRPLALDRLAGPIAIWFYPKDDTSGCTREAQAFTALAPAFAAAGVALLGISRDDAASHARFAAKHALAVPLASDPDAAAARAFGVWGKKKLYGRTYLGVERTTFLFDAEARLVRAWRKVRVPGHAEQVLAAAESMKS